MHRSMCRDGFSNFPHWTACSRSASASSLAGEARTRIMRQHWRSRALEWFKLVASKGPEDGSALGKYAAVRSVKRRLIIFSEHGIAKQKPQTRNSELALPGSYCSKTLSSSPGRVAVFFPSEYRGCSRESCPRSSFGQLHRRARLAFQRLTQFRSCEKLPRSAF